MVNLILLVGLILMIGSIGFSGWILVQRHRLSNKYVEENIARQAIEVALACAASNPTTCLRALEPFRNRARLLAEAIIALLAAPEGTARQAALSCLIQLDIPSILRARVCQGSRAGRLEAIEALAAFPCMESDRALQAAARSRDRYIRLWAMRSMQFPPSLDAVIREAETGGIAISVFLAEFLGRKAELDPEAALSALARPNRLVAVQVRLIEGIGTTRNARFLPALLNLANDSNSRIRAAAVTALGFQAQRDIQEAIRAALRDPEAQVRIAAARVAGKIPLPELADTLVAVLPDHIWRVRYEVGLGLSRLGPEGVALLRLALLKHGMTEQRVHNLLNAELGPA